MEIYHRIMFVGVICILVLLGLSGCMDQNASTGNDLPGDAGKLVGTWEGEEGLFYTFSSDGDYLVKKTKAGTWSLEREKLIIKYSSGLNFVVDYSFSENDKTLTMVSSSGDTFVYTKR